MYHIFFNINNFSAVNPAIPGMLSALAEWCTCVMIFFLYRHRTRRIHTVGVFALSACCFVLARGLYQKAIGVNNHNNPLFSFFMIINILLILLTIIVTCKAELPAYLTGWCISFLLAEFAASFAWQFCSMIFPEPSLFHPGTIAVVLLLFCCFYVGAGCFLHRFRGEIMTADYRLAGYILVVTIITFLTSNIYVVLHTEFWSGGSIDIRTVIGLLRTVIDLGGLCILLLLLNLTKQAHLTADMAAVQRLMEDQYRQYLEFRETTAYISEQHHDLKHQVARLRKGVLSEDGNRYLSEIEDSLSTYNLYSCTGNAVLDTIITQKQAYCRPRNITLTYNVNASSLEKMAAGDICTLFGNLLDNAVESVENIADQERRQIILEITARNNLLSIRTENCCDRTKSELSADGLPVTTKKDHRLHGYGMKAIKCIADKYDGSISCIQEDGWFTVSILLNISTKAI